MEVMHRRVAGLDVHKETVVACVRLMSRRKPTRECRTFATTTQGLLELLGWLTTSRVTHVAMEATGVYWTPVWKILSAGEFELTVANAAHIKQVPGRKTDMNDAMWIADLLACGLLKASFVPPENIQELRALTRTRKQLVREQTRHIQRIEKTLEDANIKLGAVLSDLLGVSGRRMIEAMIAGECDPHRLAALAKRMVKASPRELYDALHGRLREHHRFLLQLHLQQWDAIGKRKSTRLRKGAPWLKTMLVQCAWAAKRTKDSYYRAQFLRLCARRGPQKAICAVAASILTAIYHMLKSGASHRDLGADYFDRRAPEAKAKRLVAQLAKLGFAAQLQPLAEAA
jgi:transposase